MHYYYIIIRRDIRQTSVTTPNLIVYRLTSLKKYFQLTMNIAVNMSTKARD